MTHDSVAIRAASSLRDRIATAPEVALVLGSGLGDLADAAEDARSVPTGSIEGYPSSSVAGHRGRLVFGRLEGVPVAIVQGRAHLYEGHSLADVTYPIRLAHALGCRRVVLTNAAGGINAAFGPGTLMFITDHINFARAHLKMEADGRMPQRRHARVRLSRGPYGNAWLERAERAALRLGVPTRRGTYVWVRGPSYETKAEIRALRLLGGDAVGMSTVPEALQAQALEMDVLGVSTITNPAAGLVDGVLSHEDVLAAGRRVRSDLERLICGILRDL